VAREISLEIRPSDRAARGSGVSQFGPRGIKDHIIMLGDWHLIGLWLMILKSFPELNSVRCRSADLPIRATVGWPSHGHPSGISVQYVNLKLPQAMFKILDTVGYHGYQFGPREYFSRFSRDISSFSPLDSVLSVLTAVNELYSVAIFAC
jgi:hypothetical protein